MCIFLLGFFVRFFNVILCVFRNNSCSIAQRIVQIIVWCYMRLMQEFRRGC